MDEKTDPPVMYLIVRASLGMSPGKTAGQVGHAVHYLIDQMREDSGECGYSAELGAFYREWDTAGHAKIIVAADDNEFARCKELPGAKIVVDLGRTELEPNTETVVGLPPMRKIERPGWLKRLRLL